ncbi:MAG: metallophosphoesterase family protein [Proteobacteria bacterium]|nr:metallophosphoesterase family protein [Pseudomonadota bacterium]MDA1058462.1 metallophosphoesterase family protein [Pseudomonadota bacterium]
MRPILRPGRWILQRLRPPPLGWHDLGALTPPLLFFGGPYSNLHATTALAKHASTLGIAGSSCICTGDVVAYGAHPQETVGVLRELGCHVVGGNCEEAFSSRSADCGCGFAEGSRCDILSARWMDYTRRNLDDDACAWMSTLPSDIRFSVGGVNFFATHGAPSQVNRFVFDSTDASVKLRECANAEADVIIAGHCGLPFTNEIGTSIWHNPGVIGLPANDGTPRTWFSTLSEDEDGLRLETTPLDYDHTAAQTQMRQAGLPEEYAATLSTGLWDNCEILPAAETRAQGTALTAISIALPARRRPSKISPFAGA